MLVQRSHALLHDEIITTVYNMAAVDFTSFYAQFLQHFLHTTAAGVDSQHTTQLLALFHAEEVVESFFLLLMSDLCLYMLKIRGAYRANETTELN